MFKNAGYSWLNYMMMNYKKMWTHFIEPIFVFLDMPFEHLFYDPKI